MHITVGSLRRARKAGVDLGISNLQPLVEDDLHVLDAYFVLTQPGTPKEVWEADKTGKEIEAFRIEILEGLADFSDAGKSKILREAIEDYREALSGI